MFYEELPFIICWKLHISRSRMINFGGGGAAKGPSVESKVGILVYCLSYKVIKLCLAFSRNGFKSTPLTHFFKLVLPDLSQWSKTKIHFFSPSTVRNYLTCKAVPNFTGMKHIVMISPSNHWRLTCVLKAVKEINLLFPPFFKLDCILLRLSFCFHTPH